MKELEHETVYDRDLHGVDWPGGNCSRTIAVQWSRDGKSPPVKSVAAPPRRSAEILPPPSPMTPAASPGDAQMSREARAHEQYLLQSQAQAESVHRAAVARAEQRTRRLESQRWFGISNSRPTASVDP